MYYRTRRILSNILSGILTSLIVLVGFFSICCISLNLVYIKTNVEGFSMVPTFNLNVETNDQSGDTIFINRYKDYCVGDVVVAQKDNIYIIKRLVGCPGDIIQIKDQGATYGLYVNNNLLYNKEKTDGDGEKIGSTNSYYQDYLNFLTNEENANNIIKCNGEQCIKLNENEFFLIGDNWGKTSDSLTANHGKFDLFSEKEIVGKVEIVVPYGEKEESYILKYMLNMLIN